MVSNPTYSESAAKLNLVITRGNSWGPMRMTPSVADPTAGRTYAAAAYNGATKLADFSVVVADAALGVLEISMTSTESEKLSGSPEWEVSYTMTGGVKRTVFSGEIEVRAR